MRRNGEADGGVDVVGEGSEGSGGSVVAVAAVLVDGGFGGGRKWSESGRMEEEASENKERREVVDGGCYDGVVVRDDGNGVCDVDGLGGVASATLVDDGVGGGWCSDDDDDGIRGGDVVLVVGVDEIGRNLAG
nr:hypothetical protein [Tanacetum cinerariifolium]GEW48878.1 hypothetical protein [Tanacetum cinerariifolium]